MHINRRDVLKLTSGAAMAGLSGPSFSKAKTQKVLILGAGVSGLVAGYELSRLGYDFRILTVAGAANAPVIPPAQNPDGISNGVQIEAVGYGETLAVDDLSFAVREARKTTPMTVLEDSLTYCKRGVYANE